MLYTGPLEINFAENLFIILKYFPVQEAVRVGEALMEHVPSTNTLEASRARLYASRWLQSVDMWWAWTLSVGDTEEKYVRITLSFIQFVIILPL